MSALNFSIQEAEAGESGAALSTQPVLGQLGLHSETLKKKKRPGQKSKEMLMVTRH